MAFTITHSGDYTHYKFITSIMKPYELYTKNIYSNMKTMFNYSAHHGPDICEHMYYLPDDDISGTFYYEYEHDVGEYDIIAKIIVNKHTKTVYIQNLIINYFEYFYGGEPDIKFTGGMKAFKKLPESRGIIQQFLNLFFGNNYHYHLGFKKSHQKKISKYFTKQIKKKTELEYLNKDVKEHIIKQLTNEYLNIPNVSMYDIEYIHYLKENLVGTKANNWGYYYNWRVPLSIYY